MTKSVSIGGHSPKKPTPASPAEHSKSASSDEALALLNQFMRDIRKEIRTLDSVMIVGTKPRTDWRALSFIGDSFGISIHFEEGGLR